MKAIYKLRFYELDQPIAVGASDDFAFFVDPHTKNAPPTTLLPGLIWTFHNTLGNDFVELYCKILRIWHPDLGELTAIDTHGLSYTIRRTDGSTIVVNAEEDPGRIESDNQVIDDWLFLVDIETVPASQSQEPHRT